MASIDITNTSVRKNDMLSELLWSIRMISASTCPVEVMLETEMDG